MAHGEDAYYARNRRWAAEREARLEQLRRDVEESRAEFEASLHTPALNNISVEIVERKGYVSPVSGWERAEEQWAAKRSAAPPADPELRARPFINEYSASLHRSLSEYAAPTESHLRRTMAAAEAEARKAAEEAGRPEPPRDDERAYVGEDLYARGLEAREQRQAHADELRRELEASRCSQPRIDEASRRMARARAAEQYAAPTRASLAGRYGAEPPAEPPHRPVLFGHNRWHRAPAAPGSDAVGAPSDERGGLYARGVEFARRKEERLARLRAQQAARALGDSPFVPRRFSRYEPPAETRGSADGAALYARAMDARQRLELRAAEERHRRELAELEQATFRPAMSRGSRASGVGSVVAPQWRGGSGGAADGGEEEAEAEAEEGTGSGGSWTDGASYDVGSGSDEPADDEEWQRAQQPTRPSPRAERQQPAPPPPRTALGAAKREGGSGAAERANSAQRAAAAAQRWAYPPTPRAPAPGAGDQHDSRASDSAARAAAAALPMPPPASAPHRSGYTARAAAAAQLRQSAAQQPPPSAERRRALLARGGSPIPAAWEAEAMRAERAERAKAVVRTQARRRAVEGGSGSRQPQSEPRKSAEGGRYDGRHVAGAAGGRDGEASEEEGRRECGAHWHAPHAPRAVAAGAARRLSSGPAPCAAAGGRFSRASASSASCCGAHELFSAAVDGIAERAWQAAVASCRASPAR